MMRGGGGGPPGVLEVSISHCCNFSCRTWSLLCHCNLCCTSLCCTSLCCTSLCSIFLCCASVCYTLLCCKDANLYSASICQQSSFPSGHFCVAAT